MKMFSSHLIAASLIGIGIGIVLPISLIRAQERVVSGTVLDAQDGQPLAGAHIMLQSDWRRGTVSGPMGEFVFNISNVLPSDSLIITYLGFREKVIAVSDIHNDKVILLAGKASAMQGVAIIGEKLIAEEFSIQKIERLEIYKNPSAKADALLAVNALPSSTTVDETANVSFRGSSPAQTGIFLNNVPVYDAVRFSQLNGIGTFSFFNTDLIKNVQVFAGNPPLEFGNTSSGLIAIQTEDDLAPQRMTSFLVSLANTGINHRQRIGEKSSLAVYGNYQFSKPLKSFNKASLKDIESFKSLDAGIHWIYHSPGGVSMKLFNYTLNEGYKYNLRLPSFNGIFKQSRFNNLSIINLVKKSGQGTVSLNLGHRWAWQEFAYSKALYDIKNQDFYGSFQYMMEKKHSGLKLGAAYDGRIQYFEGVVPANDYAQGFQHPFEPAGPSQSKREILDAFIYYKWIPRDNLTMGFAVRKNIPWNGQDHYLSRQVNLDYHLHPEHNLKFAAGTFNQYLLPQDTLGPVRLKTQQWSLDHRYEGNSIAISTALFYKETVNKGSGMRQKNKGMEVAIQFNPDPKFRASVSYTGLIVNAKGEGEEEHPSLYDLPYFIRMGVEWNFIKLYTLGIRGLFREGVYYQPLVSTVYHSQLDVYEPVFSRPAGSIRYPGYNLLDISISSVYHLGENMGLVLFASAGNIFDFKNLRIYSYNWDYSKKLEEWYSRRTVYFGAMITF